MADDRKGLLKPTIQITIFSFIGIILNFLLQIIVAYYFGVSLQRDAYFAAIALPTYLSSILTGSLGFIFLPQVIELRNNDPKNVNVFIDTTLTATTMLLIIVIFFGVVFSKNILRLTTPGFNEKLINYTSKIFRILLFTSLFSVLTNFISYLYQIKQNFVRPTVAPLISIPISVFLVIVLHSSIGILSLAFGTLIGSLVSFLIVSPIIMQGEFKFQFKINFYESNFISMLKVSSPLLIGGILFRSAPVIERMIASMLSPGSISILGYSGQLISILSTIATSGIVVSFFPSMSDSWARNNISFIQFLNKGIRSILLVTVPIAFSFILFGDSFIKIIFQRGAFTIKDTMAVSKTFALMTPAFIMLCLGGIINKVFYISKRTVDLTVISSFELLSYFILAYVLSRHLDFIGIAISMSIVYSLFMVVYFFYSTKIIIKEYNYKLIIIDILKILTASLVSFSIAYFIFILIKNQINEFFAISISLLTTFIFYVLCLKKWNNEEIITIINKFKKKWKKLKMICQ